MILLVSKALPVLALLSQAAFAILLLCVIFRKSWGAGVASFLGRYALEIGLTVTASAVMGSLFYSVVLGFEPCELCIWQRIFIFPQLVLFVVALKRRDRSVFSYSLPLTGLATIVTLYQIYAQSVGGFGLLDCTSAGGACLKVYVNAFGFITIPVMSLTICAYLLLLAYANKKHE